MADAATASPADLLKSAQDYVNTFVASHGHDPSLREIALTSRIAEAVVAIIAFIGPGQGPGTSSVKRGLRVFEDWVSVARDVEAENEIGGLLAQIIEEASKAVGLVDNLEAVLASGASMGAPLGPGEAIGQLRSQAAALRAEISALRAEISSNAAQLSGIGAPPPHGGAMAPVQRRVGAPLPGPISERLAALAGLAPLAVYGPTGADGADSAQGGTGRPGGAVGPIGIQINNPNVKILIENAPEGPVALIEPHSRAALAHLATALRPHNALAAAQAAAALFAPM